MRNEEKLIGFRRMADLSVSICSIARDCEKNLLKNITKVEKLRKYFADSEVIVFENDSKDKTLDILNRWKEASNNILVKSEKYNSVTIPNSKNGGNPYFSKSRIDKMSFYRNKYLEIINTNNFRRDFVIIIDLDISNFSIDGIAHSFGVSQDWCCITANGKSLSKTFKMQYHDSYALVEKGNQALPMNEKTIEDNRKKFASLKHGMPLIAVDSAFGGLAIYDWNSIKGKYYSCIGNDDKRVEVLCEHVSLNKQLGGNVFINPSMKVKYRSVTISFLIEQLNKKYLESRQSEF